jgi:pimeloyl-ACP methyl ester carboxylesterase
VPRFDPAPCPKLPGAETLAKASCGYLVALENHSQPSGRSIRLMVAKYPARSPEKRPDPVVYLAGGPGDIAPLEVNDVIAADFIRDRDILVVSQRGTMFSEPALTCAPVDDFARELLGLRFYSAATERAHLAATETCHRELAATGADLSAYNSTESAADFADLRKVLGFTVWNVYGTSYGSYLAQTIMRDHPEGIRSVVLDSVLPTTYTIPANWRIMRTGFDNLFQACAAETACNAAHPHLEGTFTRLVNKLEAEPLTTTVSDPAAEVSKSSSMAGHSSTGSATRTMPWPCSARRRIVSMDSLPAALKRSRRSPKIGQVGRHRRVRMSPPSASGCLLASAAAKTTRSRRRRSSLRPAAKRFRTIRRRSRARASVAGPTSTKTAAKSGRSPPPRRPCADLSRVAFRRSSSQAALIR